MKINLCAITLHNMKNLYDVEQSVCLKSLIVLLNPNYNYLSIGNLSKLQQQLFLSARRKFNG